MNTAVQLNACYSVKNKMCKIKMENNRISLKS